MSFASRKKYHHILQSCVVLGFVSGFNAQFVSFMFVLVARNGHFVLNQFVLTMNVDDDNDNKTD